MFLPTTRDELDNLGWHQPDVILVTGDAYIDSPYIGISVIGRVLEAAGYKVGIIAQPDIDGPADITRLGEPRLFWGVSAGSIDSMVANYTALKKRRRSDDFTPGGSNNRRPDRASIVYSNLIRRYFKDTVPIVLGGLEASLRRIAHYDFWSNSIRRSLLFDAKADILSYGMGEKTVLELARRLDSGEDLNDIRGICYIISGKRPDDFIDLPAFETVRDDEQAFSSMFKTFYDNKDPVTGRGMCQLHGERYLVHNPPAVEPSERELDSYYELGYERDAHPYYADQGPIRALETIRFSITTHRGCYGECNFCSIAVHQGRRILSRSQASILKEARSFRDHPQFKGIISDVGGPTANMYRIDCVRKEVSGSCANKRCLFPGKCSQLRPNHADQIKLLQDLRNIEGVRKVFVASGVRYDLLLKDYRRNGERYLRELVRHHISGQMKIAPEHTRHNVLALMGKPDPADLSRFKALFDRINREEGKRQFLTYYFIAAHPGCTLDDMQMTARFATSQLHLSPEQVQIFTPLPSTWSALMYHTAKDPFSGRPIFVEKDPGRKQRQKDALTRQTKHR